jgi:hypothetical protein
MNAEVSSRFTTNMLMLLVAGFLITACFAFSPSVIAWLALGGGSAAVLTALVGFAIRGRGAGQRWLDVCVALTGAWMIVASRAYDGPVQRWLSFGGAAALAGYAVIGLVAHELTADRHLAGGVPQPTGVAPRPIPAGVGASNGN